MSRSEQNSNLNFLKSSTGIQEAFLNPHISRSYSTLYDFRQTQLMRNSSTDEKVIESYLEENVLKFLLEFAGGIKQTRVLYENQNGRIFFPGMKQSVESMLERSARIKGENSREQSELLGFQKVQALLNSGASEVWQASPPSNNPLFGDYSFLFQFKKKSENSILMSVNRYAEKKETTLQSRYLFNRLLVNGGFSVENFLKNPVGFTHISDELRHDLENKGILDASNGDYLETAIVKDVEIKKLLKQYIYVMATREFNQKIAKQILAKLYLRACEIVLMQTGRMKTDFIPRIFMGTSCAVSDSNQSNLYLPRYSSFSEVRVTRCPGCSTRQLLTSEHVNKGLTCNHCRQKVNTKCDREAIFNKSKLASYYEKEKLQPAETTE